MPTQTVRAHIIGGPNREALFDALKYAYYTPPHRVRFICDDEITYTVQVEGLLRHGTTGCEFEFIGNVVSRRKGDAHLALGRRHYVHGQYNTQTREGWIEFDFRKGTLEMNRA